METITIRLGFRVELRNDGKWYGACLINGIPQQQSPPFDTEKEAAAECDTMLRMIKRETPATMAAQGFEVRIEDVGLA